MSDVSFVRNDMLPEQAPPASSVGVVGWLRANLFSSWLNSILTIVSLSFIWYVLAGLVPWVLQSVWAADSLGECREVMIATWGETHGHACWAVIRERWLQLLFGFYPPEFYWRPILSFILLILAVAPVLFADRVPKKLLYVTAAYPLVMPWLMWGGTFWTPLLVLAGLGVGYGIYRLAMRFTGTVFALPLAVLGAVLWWLVAMAPISLGIHKMVASPQMDSRLAEMQARVETLKPEVATIKDQLKELGTQIAKAETEKDDAFEGLSDLIHTGEEAGKPHSEIVDSSEFQALNDIFNERLSVLSGYKAEARILSGIQNTKDGLMSEARVLANRIEILPETEAALPDLKRTAKDLRAALPKQYRSIGSSKALNASDLTPTAEEKAQLEAVFDAESELLDAHNLVNGTYKDVGRIGPKPVPSRQFGGFMLSILIGVVAIGCSLPIGIVLALGRQSDLLIVKGLCVGFIEFIRGVPLITLLFVASTLLNIFMPPGTNFDIILRVMIMVTLFASAYMAEVIRGGLAALPKGQYEGADSLGLNYWQAQRLIIMPQALKISIPGIVSTFIGVFKDTTLVSIIGLLDPIGLATSIRADTAWNGIYWELFAFIALLFFIFCFSMSRYSMYLERKLRTDHR